MRITAKEAADRLRVSYVVAAGIMAHLEETGAAKVVEKKFHASGKGKPTRVYEVEQHTVLNFGDVAAAAAAPVVEPVVVEPVVFTTPVVEAPAVVEVVEEKIETLDHVAAALARLKADNAA